MPKVDYTWIESMVKEKLECLFWIEIAKRKAQIEDPAFSSLQALRHELVAFFSKFQAELEEGPAESWANIFFDTVQQVSRDSAYEPQQEAVLQEALSQFAPQAESIHGALIYGEGFRLSDFSTTTNLQALYGWWSYITSSRGKSEMNSRDGFSPAGELRRVIADPRALDNDNKSLDPTETNYVIMTTTSGIRFPTPMPVTEKTARIYFSAEQEILVDGQPLKERLLFEFDVTKPLPSMRHIERTLRLAHGAARAAWYMDQLDRGKSPKELPPLPSTDRSDSLLHLLSEPPESHQLTQNITSVSPMITGLVCWDYAAAKMSQAKAVERTVETLRDHDGKSVLTFEQVERGHQKVRAAVQKYEPGHLPWNHQAGRDQPRDL